MEVYELFVNDQNYDTEDGYTLLFHEPYKLGLAIETALLNGFKDIRVSKADVNKKIQYMKRLRDQQVIFNED